MYKLSTPLFLKLFVLSLCVSHFAYAELPPIIDLYETTRSSEIEHLRSEIKSLTQQLNKANDTIKSQASLLESLQHKPKNRLFGGFGFKKPKTDLKPSAAQSLKAPTEYTDPCEKEWEEADRLLRNHQYKEAAKGFQRFIKKYPTHVREAEAYAILTQIELLKGDAKASLRYAKLFLKKYPEDIRSPIVQFQMGVAYYAQKNNAMAYKTLTQLIEHYPNHVMAEKAKEHLKAIQLKG